MDQDLAAELNELESALPSVRHLPTLTLDKAVELVEKTRDGATEEQRLWLTRLIVYSCGHTQHFIKVCQRVAELRAKLGKGTSERRTNKSHPLLTDDQLLALLNVHRAFHAACDAFVEGNGKDELRQQYQCYILNRADADAIGAALALRSAFPPAASMHAAHTREERTPAQQETPDQAQPQAKANSGE